MMVHLAVLLLALQPPQAKVAPATPPTAQAPTSRPSREATPPAGSDAGGDDALAQLPTGPTEAAATEQLARAEARYRAAIALTPEIAAFHESLARVLERQGRTADALASHREAVRLDSSSARSRAGLGALLLRTGKPNEAVAHLEAARDLDPSSIEVRRQLADALRQVGRGDEAAGVLREAQRLDPADSALARAADGDAAAGAQGSHDLSGFDDDELPGWGVRRAIELVFAVILGLSALVLAAPILGTLLAVLRHLPELARR